MASTSVGTIDTTNRYAWSENAGWIDFGTTLGAVLVTDTALSGYAYSENAGWISLNCSNTISCATNSYAVTNNNEGTLSGYAWSENAGWINFAPSSGGVTINSSGIFSGYAYSENMGWINFTADHPVTTDWRPASSRTVPNTPTSSGGSSSGGGGSAQSQMNNLISMNSPATLLAYVNQNRALLIALQAQGQQLPPQVLALLSPTIIANPILPENNNYSAITYKVASSTSALSSKAISALKNLPSGFLSLVNKFPELGKTIASLATSVGNNILAKLKSAKLTLPGLSKEAGLSTGVPIASLTSVQKKSLPTEVVFAKSGDLIDYNVSLAVSDQGMAEQTIHTVAGKSIDLALKPDKPVSNITGYLTIKNIDRQQAMKAIRANSMLTASIGSLLAQSYSPKETPVVDNKLVLATFTYSDPDKDGIYTAHIDAPLIHGEYDILTIMEYKDSKFGSKEFHLTTVVDPEGYVYQKSGNLEARIPNAKVGILMKNPKTSAFELWPASNYKQVNPQKTDATGMYSFLVPEGAYKLNVSASSYYDYTGAEFQVTQGAGIHENIELVPIATKHWWTNLFNWFGNLLH